jgi:hypothetical protein
MEHQTEEFVMSRFLVTLIFSLIAMSGLGMVIYGILIKPSGNEENRVVLGFQEPGEESVDILDDLGHEGMRHTEKETLDPGKYRSEPIEIKK